MNDREFKGKIFYDLGVYVSNIIESVLINNVNINKRLVDNG